MKIYLHEDDLNEMVDLWIDHKFYRNATLKEAYLTQGPEGEETIVLEVMRTDLCNPKGDET